MLVVVSSDGILGWIRDEPGLVVALWDPLASSSKRPDSVIPNLKPVVVVEIVGELVLLVVPVGGSSKSGRHAHGSAGVHDEDGEASARGVAGIDGLERAHDLGSLVSYEVEAPAFPDVLVERQSSLTWRGGVGDERLEEVPEEGTPFVSLLVDAGVGDYLVEEDVPGDLLGVGESVASHHGQLGVDGHVAKRDLIVGQVFHWHVFEQEFESQLKFVLVLV